MTDPEAAKDLVQRFSDARSTEQPPLEITAYHEAGHLAAMLHCGVEVKAATIEPIESAWGHVAPRADKIPFGTQLFYLYCGEYAETQHTGNHLTAALRQSQVDGDVQIIDRIAALIEEQRGSAGRFEILAAAEKAAYEFTTANAELITALANLLVQRRTITGEEAQIIYNNFRTDASKDR